MIDEEINPDDVKKLISRYNVWVKKNWIVLVAILVIVLIVGYDMKVVNSRIATEVEKCNEHWRNQVLSKCPELMGNDTWMSIDLNEINQMDK